MRLLSSRRCPKATATSSPFTTILRCVASPRVLSRSRPSCTSAELRLTQTAHNLYLCFDLCTGGELFDRICAKGNYYEECVLPSPPFPGAVLLNDRAWWCRDAATLVRTIMGAVKYIHECGIVHRGQSLPLYANVHAPCPLLPALIHLSPYVPHIVDLKPENLLFRSKEEEADIMIADFGLSRVMDDEKFHLLTEICGTPGVRRPCLSLRALRAELSPISTWRPRSSRKVRRLRERMWAHADGLLVFSGPRKAGGCLGHGCDHLLPALRCVDCVWLQSLGVS